MLLQLINHEFCGRELIKVKENQLLEKLDLYSDFINNGVNCSLWYISFPSFPFVHPYLSYLLKRNLLIICDSFPWYSSDSLSLSCRAHPPTDWFIAGCLEVEVRTMLRKVSFRINPTLVFWNACVYEWYMWVLGWIIHLVHIHIWSTL